MKSKNESTGKRKASELELGQLGKQQSLEEEGVMEISQEEFYQQKAPKKQKEIPTRQANSSKESLSSIPMEELLKLMFSQTEDISLTQLNPNLYSSIFSPLNEEQQKGVLTQTTEISSADLQFITIDDEEPDLILPQTREPGELQNAQVPTLTIDDDDEEKEKEKELATEDSSFPRTMPAQSPTPIFYLDDNKSIEELENSINLSVKGVSVKFHYKAGKKDRPDLVYIAPVDIISSQQTHYGVYARSFIKKGTVLFEYTGEKVSDEEDNDGERDRAYFMLLRHKQKILDAKYQGNGSRFINDSTAQENVEFREKKKKMLVIAAKDMFEGEQLLVSYGDTYQFGFKPFFLHPSDNFRSAQKIFEANKDYYHPVVYNFANCPYDLSPLGISKEDTAFITKPVYDLLHNKSIIKYDSFSHLPLPILKVKEGQFIPLGQQERITLLLMAAYLGKATVLKRLLQNPKMDTTIQQAMSGRTALHLVCLGTSLDRIPRDVKNRLAALELLLTTPCLDFKDGNKRAPIFTLIDNASSCYLVHFLHCIKPSLNNFQGHKKNGLDPFFYALKMHKKDHALVILQYMGKIGKLSNYVEYVKEFVRKKLIFTNGHFDLSLIADCNEVLEKVGIPKMIVKVPNLFRPRVAISNDRNKAFREDLQSNSAAQGN
ncbi:SET domain-containing protein-lysine N-methyltransferase [Legionella sp.]|uniref:SET domain-containing protein-lysine N-methyltransferase n=1 Tax=Legionella sp. TaxID=459 RepID=UPI000CB4D42C|nr:SET domain-containing protein-lysine N-methyltransferase [Legionella sp.]PJE08202.1 MAG: hypothetical protein CK430_12750 [Legionella sp.]